MFGKRIQKVMATAVLFGVSGVGAMSYGCLPPERSKKDVKVTDVVVKGDKKKVEAKKDKKKKVDVKKADLKKIAEAGKATVILSADEARRLVSAVSANYPYANPNYPDRKVRTVRLTTTSLRTMLTNMGYRVETLSPGSLNPKYRIRMTRHKLNLIVNVSLSSDGSTMWLSAPVLRKSDVDRAPARALKKLLAANWDITPSVFKLGSDGMLYLSRFKMNKDMTAVKVRDEIEGLAKHLDKTRDLWNPRKWNQFNNRQPVGRF